MPQHEKNFKGTRRLTLEDGSLTSPATGAVAGGSLDPILEHLQTIMNEHRMKFEQRVATLCTFNGDMFLHDGQQ